MAEPLGGRQSRTTSQIIRLWGSKSNSGLYGIDCLCTLQNLHVSLDIHLLAAEACRYYLPACLYAMTDPEDIWRYLGSVLSTLWYEDELETRYTTTRTPVSFLFEPRPRSGGSGKMASPR